MRRIRPLYRRDEWACVDRFLEYTWILKNLPPNEPHKLRRVLEIGPGWSLLFTELLRRGYLVYALDIVAYPTISNTLELSFIRADATKVPLKGSSFDVIVSVSVIEHIEHKEKCFMEISRVLKSEGLALITMPIGRKEDQISPTDVSKLIHDTGFIVLEEQYWRRGKGKWIPISKEEAKRLWRISEKFKLNPANVLLSLKKS